MLLKLDLQAGGVELVLPKRASVVEGLRFLEQQRGWMTSRIGTLPPRVAFENGALVPLQGVPHRIRHLAGARGAVWLEGREIRVAGAAEHVRRRVRDWLRARAGTELGGRARALAGNLGLAVARVSIRDTATRWGSCSAAGALSFSWRLILAPDEVIDYVVAHEVAHLREMNHGPRFWTLVRRLSPQSDTARHWLRVHGPALYRYG